MRDTIGVAKGVVEWVVIVGVQGSFGLGCGKFVGLTTSRLFLGLFIETGGFGILWGSPTCNRLSKTLNRDNRLLCSACSAECSCSTCASRVSSLTKLSLSVSSGCYLTSVIVGSRAYGNPLATIFTHYLIVWTVKSSVVGTRVWAVL